MTFLPLIERELRVRARGRIGYWTRCGAALGGLVMCLPLLLGGGAFGAGGSFGRAIFNGLVAAAFVLSCSACVVTAAGIAVEQREGTLGLLFLTRVKALDILLGKLGAAGLTSLCGLLAFVPVMMVPLLAGGVTGGEAFRKGLALLATLCLSLAAGLWASACGRRSSVMRKAVGAIVLLALVPYAFWRMSGSELRYMGVLSPLVAVVSGGDAAYAAGGRWYWTSLLGVTLLAGLALAAAGAGLRRMTEPEPFVPPAPQVPFTLFGKEVASGLPWRRAEQGSPVAWLVRRQPGVKARLWAAGILAFFYHNLNLFMWRLVPRSTWAVAWGPGLAISAVESALIAWAASRFFAEARHTAEFEVLLTTPAGARQVVRGQTEALLRLLRWPLALMLLPSLFRFIWLLGQLTAGSRFVPGVGFPADQVLSLLLSLAGVCLHVGALCWLGMWFGLKTRSQAAAVAWSVVLTTVLPYVVSMLFYIPFGFLFSSYAIGRRAWYFLFLSLLPQLTILALTLGLILWARDRLLRELHPGGATPLGFKEMASALVRDVSGGFRKARHWTPS